MAEPFKRGEFVVPQAVEILPLTHFSFLSSEMQVTAEEMAEAKVPLNLRDYCAHHFIPLMKCRKDNYYLPWKCKKEKHAWEECQFQE